MKMKKFINAPETITDEELEEFLNQARSQILDCRKLLQDVPAEEDDL